MRESCEDDREDNLRQVSPPSATELLIEDSAPAAEEQDLFEMNPHMAFVDSMIDRLMKAQTPLPNKRLKKPKVVPEIDVTISKSEALRICKLAVDDFQNQGSLVTITREQLPLTIIGDIHGQLRELRHILHYSGSPEDMSYLFLGDYVDRGPQSIATFCLLLCLKVRYPNKVYLLRGNHEDYNTSLIYGFYDECATRYPFDLEQIVYQSFVATFNYIPFAAHVCNKILAMHGGLSPDLKKLEDISSIHRPLMIPLSGLETDLVWADPGSTKPGWAQSNRGISFMFDDTTIDSFCQDNRIEYMVRGHQVSNLMTFTGYRFTNNGRMLTLFSAYNYLNSGNTGGTLQLRNGKNEKITAQFVCFRPSVGSTPSPNTDALRPDVFDV